MKAKFSVYHCRECQQPITQRDVSRHATLHQVGTAHLLVAGPSPVEVKRNV